MVQQVRASLTCFIILFLLVSVLSSNTEIHTSKVVKDNRKTWMNHGSHRGPRKHLVNPTAQKPFQALEFPV
ncbi:hypothetical protein Lalb_Chr05g0215671 [Lupinus albus]|uniref:Encoded peptide n=1 Tax=Lupinus albus TaxID=3870 RepID=A0A6A4QFX9_LUPAL|nr:hypothetical protein Lalb_Chr05g0215671 [Lupinus albus]